MNPEGRTPSQRTYLDKVGKLITKYDSAKKNIEELFNLRHRIQNMLQRNLTEVGTVMAEAPYDVKEEWHHEVAFWWSRFADFDTWNYGSQYTPYSYNSLAYQFRNVTRFARPPSSHSLASTSASTPRRHVLERLGTKEKDSIVDQPSNSPPSLPKQQVGKGTNGNGPSLPEHQSPVYALSRKRSLSEESSSGKEEFYECVEEQPHSKRQKTVTEEEDEAEKPAPEENSDEVAELCINCFQMHKTGDCQQDSDNEISEDAN